MPTTTITAAFVNPPREGKKQGNIKTPEGAFYGVKPEMLALFAPGGKYEVEYSEREWQGKTFRTIEKSKSVGGSPVAKPNGAGGRYGPTDDVTAERIFVCGGFNALLSNPSFASNVVDAKVYIAIVKNLRQAWLETFGGKPSFATEMDDEIPE